MELQIKHYGVELYTQFHENRNQETVILLHGGPGFPSDLMEIAEFLKTKYQVISFHQRGTKRSPCASHDYSMQAYISDIDVIAQYFKLEKFHLFGHSWGGLYAQIYASINAHRLLSLFLCCPGSGTNIEWIQTEKEVMELNKSKTTNYEWMMMGINNVLGILGSDNAYKRLFKQVMKNYNNDFINSDAIVIDFENLKAEPINKTRNEIIQYPLLPILNDKQFKISIVYGDQDIYKSSKNFVIKRYPNAQLYTIENCGHIPWLHNPEQYNEILNLHYSMN